ncbi:MAG: hypothetical protein J6B54_05140 [Clostridia bacterium]|nr:hypothetical protein [Clostridia bacterium]
MLFFRKKLKKTTKEDDALLARAMEENKVGFKDKFAMSISAILVLVLPSLLILLVLSGFVMLLFGGFR